MAPPNAAHARSHSLLLLQKLLNLRDGASPLTLVIDSLEQSARPVLAEYTTRAKLSKTRVIFLALATLKPPEGVDVFIKASGKSIDALRKELMAQSPKFDPSKPLERASQRAVILIDSLNALASSATQPIAMFLSSIITPATSVVAVHHADVPIALPKLSNEYEPHPFTILCHLATAILRVSSLEHEIDCQRARNRALQEPRWGLSEDREGVLFGLCGNTQVGDTRSTVLEMELRRKSGRTVTEKFILKSCGDKTSGQPGSVSLLKDHEMFRSPTDGGGSGAAEDGPESTFNLGLTEKQRKDREGIVLPYFDAQTDIGAGEGGRILYEMGREDMDDFDDEEDEEI